LSPRSTALEASDKNLSKGTYSICYSDSDSIRFKDPKAAILTLKMLTGSRLGFCKIIPEAACDKLILAHFPCSQ
jgi:hypothetical protein